LSLCRDFCFSEQQRIISFHFLNFLFISLFFLFSFIYPSQKESALFALHCTAPLRGGLGSGGSPPTPDPSKAEGFSTFQKTAMRCSPDPGGAKQMESNAVKFAPELKSREIGFK
jgi:hypothetical protein